MKKFKVILGCLLVLAPVLFVVYTIILNIVKCIPIIVTDLIGFIKNPTDSNYGIYQLFSIMIVVCFYWFLIGWCFKDE